MESNPLEIDGAPQGPPKPASDPPNLPPAESPPQETTSAEPNRSAQAPRPAAREISLIELALQEKHEADVNPRGGDAEAAAETELPSAGVNRQPLREPQAPIHITIGPQGVVLSSSDTEALDRLEELIGNLAPQRTSYKIFRLQHTYAKDVALLLEDVYKEGDDKKSGDTDFWERFYFGYSGSNQKQTARSSLSKRRPLAFVPDPVTNTILVQGADDAQLAEIEQLIAVYDRVEPADSNAVRRQQMITLEYSNARQVAEMVKDVYRDLLSPNDKALANPAQQQKQEQQQGYFPSIYSYLASAKDDSEKNIPRFKGMLSVGVDPLSNSLVVSAPQGLLSEVVAMIEEIDRAAQPLRPVTHVFRVNQPGAAEVLRDALSPGGRASSPRRNGSADDKATPAKNSQGRSDAGGKTSRNGGSRNGNGTAPRPD
jgi:hypothetical protein